jgi:SpoVK/Ycf46/Vps4 family AAA+-type ATPase
MAPLQPAVPAPLVTVVPPAQDSTTLEELRERVEAMLPHDLEHRLHERAMASLERTLIDIERGFRDELASWREEQTVQIRVEVRAEVERAVDEVLAELARQRRPGAR